MAIIEARGLSMRFGYVNALCDVSFDVREGEILGLLGPNGAGKTTAMRILTTYLVPTSGTATVAGFDVVKDPLEVRRRIGYLPETAPLYPDMEVHEYLRFVGEGRGLGREELKRQLDFVIQACELKPVFRRPILELSKGYKQRVGLAQSLMHDPELLILDEPTSGLDPLQIIGIRDLLRGLIARKKTIIFSTHIMQEVVEMCNRVIIVRQGRIAQDGTVAEVCRSVPVEPKVVVSIDSAAEEIAQELIGMNARVTREDGSIRAEFLGSTGDKIFETLRARPWPIREIREVRTSLEDAFRYHTQESRR